MLYIYIGLIILAILTFQHKYLDYLIIAFLGWLATISTNAADFTSYENIYYVISSDRLYETSYGWYVLNNIGRSLNLNYAQFKGVLTIIALLLILITCHIFLGRNYNYIWGLYLLYPALLNIVQIRFFVAMAISTFAMIFLERNKIYSILIYFLLISIEISIHTWTAFYLLFLFIPIIEKNKRIFSEIIIIGTIILIPFRSLVRNTIAFFATSRQTSYFEVDQAGSMSTIIITISVVIIFYLLSKKTNMIIKDDERFTVRQKKLSELINNVNLCLLVLIPVILLSTEFARVQRISWLLMYIQVTMLSVKEVKVPIGRIQISSKLLGNIIALFGFCVMLLYLAPLAFSSIFNS